MASKSIKRVRPTIHIPTVAGVYGKIIITADDSTEYTVMNSYDGTEADNYLITANIVKNATTKLSTFSIVLINDNGALKDVFNGGERIRVYADATDATTLMFTGKIEDVSYSLNASRGFLVSMKGMDYPELNDKTITGLWTASLASTAIAGILNADFSNIKLQFWNGTEWATATYVSSDSSGNPTVTWDKTVTNFPTTLINTSYQDKKAISTLASICQSAEIDSYLYYDETADQWYYRTMNYSEYVNENSNISYGINLLSLDNYGVSNSQVVNNVTVYGETDGENVILLSTKADSASQANLWEKDRTITANGLNTMSEVQNKANYELTKGINTAASGNVKTLCLWSLNAGESIFVSIPYTPAQGYHKVTSLTHNFNSNSITTTVNLSQYPKSMSDIFVKKYNEEDYITPADNKNAMTDSYTVHFDENPSVMTLANTAEENGQLKLVASQTTGTATSDTVTLDYDVTQCEFRIYSNYYVDNDVYEVSNQGGAPGTWETYDINSGMVHTFDVPGNRICFRITLNRTLATDMSPKYESVCLLVKA